MHYSAFTGNGHASIGFYVPFCAVSLSRPNTDDDTVFTSVAGIDKTITRKRHSYK